MRLIFIVLALLSGSVHAERCVKFYGNYTTCSFAKAVTKSLAKDIPFDVNSEVSVTAVSTTGSTVFVLTKEISTRKEVEFLLDLEGITFNEYKEPLISNSFNSLCGIFADDEVSKKFFRSGGYYRYDRFTSDGHYMFQYHIGKDNIDTCPESL